MNDFEKSSDSIKYGSRDPNLLEQEKEKKKKKRSRNDLMFNSPGRLQAQIDPRRRSKPPNFLLPEYTSEETYRCASVRTIFRGPTEVEFRATFLSAREADRSGVEEEDNFPNSENLIELENEFALDKDKCPCCRGRMDCDVEMIFIGNCAICFDTHVKCSLVCSSQNSEHGLCDECFEHYKQ